MTTTASVLADPGARVRTARPHVGELLLVGGATFVLFPLAWVLRAGLGIDSAELAFGFVTFYAAHVINDPHFSVTYLLFYKDVRRRAFDTRASRMQRARFLLAGFVAPLGLAIWAAASIAAGSAYALGLLIQLMFLLVGWHYVKQGFGVLSVLSARRSFSFSPVERKALLLHCYAGWAYAWASPFDPGREVEEKGVVYTSLAHPHGLELATGIVFAASAVLLAVVVIRGVRARRSPPPAPLIVFLATIWLWTVYSSVDPLMVYVIPALHSVQYLYFVWLLERNKARAAEGPPTFGRPTGMRLALLAASALGLGWLLFHGAPTALDGALVLGGSTGDLGPTPYFAALFAIVNIHHYFMDSVIWRRENPDTRFLMA